MLKKIDTVIFDLDGSLVDSMWMWKRIDEEFLAARNLTLPKDFQKCIEGMSFTETAEYSKQRFSLSESVEELKEIWVHMAQDKYAKEVFYKPNAEKFLQYCKEKKISMGIATSNSRELVEIVSKALGISNYIQVIVTSCEVAKGKPSPDVYLEVAKRLMADPRRCLVFEDVPAGILAGKNANMTVCAVDDEFSKEFEREKRHLADYYIYDYNQMIERMEREKEKIQK